MRTIFLVLFSLVLSNVYSYDFRVGLANIYFFGALYENNLEKPLFKALPNPPTREQELEMERMNLEYLARYFRYLDADILALCEAPGNPQDLEKFVKDYLNDEYYVVHNSPVVKNRKYYFNQQVAALVRKDMFLLRKYEALEDGQLTESNRMYPFEASRKATLEGEEFRVYWSRFPIEFDVALKQDPGHYYKFILTYPKSKFARGKKASKKARIQNLVQQQMVRSRIEKVAPHFEDIFVLGDMNDDMSIDPVEEELGTNGLMGLYHGDSDPILWNPIRFFHNQGTYIYKGNPSVLDYIFTSRGLQKGKGRVEPKYFEHYHFFKTMVRNQKRNRPDRMLNRELFLSDHAPVTLDVDHYEKN